MNNIISARYMADITFNTDTLEIDPIYGPYFTVEFECPTGEDPQEVFDKIKQQIKDGSRLVDVETGKIIHKGINYGKKN